MVVVSYHSFPNLHHDEDAGMRSFLVRGAGRGYA